jgi:hypothetical protein
MGSTGSALCDRVKSLSEAELSKTSKEDDELALITDELYKPNFVKSLKDLSGYEIPIIKPRAGSGEDGKTEEVKFAFVHHQESRKFDKHEDLRNALQSELYQTLSKEEDPDFKDLCLTLQGICRVQEALIRQEERERRRVQKSSQSQDEKKKKKPKELPPIAKAGMNFCISTMLDLIEIVGLGNRLIYEKVLKSATRVLSDLPPLSLNVEDPSVLENLEYVKEFLERILKGECLGSTSDETLISLAPLFGLALAKGNLSSALSVALKLLFIENSEVFSRACCMILPLVKNLSELEGSTFGRRIQMNWNPNKLGPDMALSNENLTVTRTDSSGWGCQLTEQSLTSGIHYYEFKIDRNNSSCLLLGVAGSLFSNFTSKSSGPHCYTLQADGDAYMNERGSGNIFRYVEGDRIGILINMEDKTLTFFHNGKKQSKPAFSPLPDEVFLLACFGGANQFVSVINEPEIPEEAQEVIGAHVISSSNAKEEKIEEVKGKEKEEEVKEGQEVVFFPVSSRDIIKSPRFIKIEQGQLASPKELAVYILACLDKLNETYFKIFNLSEKPSCEPIKAKLNKQQPLCLEIKPDIFEMFSEMLEYIVSVLKLQDWKRMDFHLCIWAGMCLLRLLRSHLFTVLYLQLKDEETGITQKLRTVLFKMLQEILELDIHDFGLGHTTKEETDALSSLKKEACLTLIHGFEVFYPTQIAKLDYINISLEDTKARKNQFEVYLNIQKLVLDKMSIPVNLSAAFTLDYPGADLKITKLLELLVDICYDSSLATMKGVHSADSEYYLRFLHTVQKVIVSKAGKDDFKGVWQTILVNHALKLVGLTSKLISELSTEEITEKGSGTLLESLVSSLLYCFTLSDICIKDISVIMPCVMTLVNTLNCVSLSSIPKIMTCMTETFETVHPLVGAVNDKTLKFKSASKYLLKFDPQCATFSDKHVLNIYKTQEKKTENLLASFKLTQFPSELLLETSELFFSYSTDGEGEAWGWKIDVESEVEKENSIHWLHHLKLASNFLVVFFSKRLICGDFSSTAETEAKKLLKSSLFKYGIKDKCAPILIPGHRPIVNEGLIDLSMIPTSFETISPHLSRSSSAVVDRIRKSSFPGFKANEVNPLFTLTAYINTCINSSHSGKHFSENPLVDEWIRGSDLISEAWNSLKIEAGAVGPHYNIGGSELEQAERTVFAVYASLFGFADFLGLLIETKKIHNKLIKELIKQACQIRKWAQHRKQAMLDENKEVDYSSISLEIVYKSVVILNSEHLIGFNQQGIYKIQRLILPSLRELQSVDVEMNEDRTKKSSKWNTVKKTVESMGKIRTLLKIIGPVKQSTTEQDDEKKELVSVNGMIFEFFESKVNIDAIFEEIETKRNLAIARAIGFNYLIHMFKTCRKDKNLKGQIIRIFSDSLRLGSSSKKKHYLSDLEGIDIGLQQCLQKSFFSMIQLLLTHLTIKEVKELDCTSQQSTHFYLKIFEALSFPYEEIDTNMLIDLKLHESISFLLRWAKGSNIHENIVLKFNKSKCITSFKVHNEDEYLESQHEGAEAFSLNTANRLDSEYEHEAQATGTKLCMQVFRGEEKVLPIVAIETGNRCPEGFEKIEGNINEQGEELFIFIKRAEPVKGLCFLTKVEVIEDNPLVFRPTFTPFDQLLVKQQDQSEDDKRSERKKLLKNTSWVLLKQFVYTCAGKPEHLNDLEASKEIKKFKLQSLFAELLLDEVAWVKTKERVDREEADIAKLKLMQVSSGELWMDSNLEKPMGRRNPMKEWLGQFREIFASLNSEEEGDLLFGLIDGYISELDPTYKGVVQCEVQENDESFDPNDWKNSRGEIDFFVFLNSSIKKHKDDINQDILTHPFMSWIPADVDEASLYYTLDIPVLVEVIRSKMHPERQNSFSRYLELVLQTADKEKLGIVTSEFLPPGTPPEFLNSTKSFDLYVAINSILNDRHLFSSQFEEIKTLQYMLKGLPHSCEELYLPQKTDSSINEYIASVLWVIYQTSCSESMKKVIAKPEYLEVIIKHALLGASESVIVIAFRILRNVVPTQHSPQTFAAIWSTVHKDLLEKFLSKEISADWLKTILSFIGIRNSYHIKNEREFIPNLSKLGIWSSESCEFLKTLFLQTRWKAEIVPFVHIYIQNLVESLKDNVDQLRQDLGLGALSFIATCSSSYNPLDKSVQEWSFVSLKGGSLPQGFIITLNKKTKVIQVYNEEDDCIHEESLNHLNQVQSLIKANFFSTLPSQDIGSLFQTLTQIIRLIKEKEGLIEVESPEKLHNIRCIWRQIEALVYHILASLPNMHQLFSENEANEIVDYIFGKVVVVDHGDFNENSLKYRALRKNLYNKIKEVKLDELKKQENNEIEIREDKEEEDEEEKAKTIPEDEEAKIVMKMTEEQQILIATLKSLNYTFTDIYAALNAGFTKYEQIEKFIQDRMVEEKKPASDVISATSDSRSIYKLCKEEESTCQIVDHTGIVHFDESVGGQLSIISRMPLDEVKYIKKHFATKIFRSVSEFCSEITILATIGFAKENISGVICFTMGALEIKFNSLEDSTLVLIKSEPIGSLEKSQNYSFKLFVTFNGKVDIEFSSGQTYSLSEPSIYDGVSLADFGVGLEQGESVVLRGLMVCLGRFTTDAQYWDIGKVNSGEIEGKSAKLADLKPQEQNQTALRLRTTGAPTDLCSDLAKEHVSLDKALSSLLSDYDSSSWADNMETSVDAPITEVIMCESSEDIEEGYIKVPILKDGVDISESFSLDNRKIICYKQHLSPSPPGNVITAVLLKGPDESHKEDTDIGNMAKSAEGEVLKVWVTKVSRSKLGTRQPLTKIIIVTGTDENSISIPTGFEIVCLAGNPVNIGNPGEFAFVCTSKTSKLLGYPITPLIYSKVAVSEHGLVDALDSSSSDMNNERLKKVDEEIQVFSQYSIIELHNHVKNLDKIASNLAMKTFLLQIIQSHPTTLPHLLCKKPDNFAIIFALLKENLSVLESTIKKVISTSIGQNMCKILLHECIFQVILASSCAAPTGKLAEQLIESTHPYENNMRHDQVISIPGAAGLRIEFDSQCHTETGCDILRFYKQPNHMAQISENTGRSFSDFEVEGDTIHLYFYSDSSCVEWGYKFRVIPIESAPRNSIDPLLKRMSIEHAFWILEKVVLGFKELPFNLQRFNKKEMVNPLVIYLHTCKETYKQERVLKIIQGLLTRPSESLPALQNVVSLIAREVRSLYNIEKNNKAVSSLLQRLVGLITELKGKFRVDLDERWFHDICDAFALMKGFVNRDENIFPVLFEQFRLANKIPLEKYRESAHPYSKKYSTKSIHMKGASFLEIEFDEKSKLDIQDAILFTYDEQGAQLVETGTDASLTDACWSNDSKGPDIVYLNNNRSVTRTNSSGWGCALWSETYSQGRIKINFLIDNDGRSDYLYIGVLKADGSYRLNEVINSDNTHDLWTWKTTGEFHKRGEKTPVTDAKYRTGDIVTLLINMEDRCLTCIKNNAELHTFHNIAEEVIPIICFGGSNQHVTVASVESYIASFSKLSKKKLIVNRDLVYFHFPINYGYLVMPMHAWKKPANISPNLAFSQDQRKVKTTAAVDPARILQVTGLALQAGRHFVEFLVKKVKEGDKLQVGMIPDTQERTGSLVKETTVCYQSSGSVFVNGSEKTVEPIRATDRVSFFVDLEKSQVSVYKNLVEVFTGPINPEHSKNYVFAVSFDSDKQEVLIVKKPTIPGDIDLIGVNREVQAGAVAKEWGYKFKVTPCFTGNQKMKVIECLPDRQLEKWKGYIDKYLNNISKATEEQLVQYVDEFCAGKKKDPMKLDPEEIAPSQQDLRHYRLLEDIQVVDLREMFKMILSFNKQIEKILPLISLDLTTSSRESLDELQRLFLSTREYIFATLKNNMFNAVISGTNSESRPDVSIDRTKAMRMKYSGKIDSQAIVSIFGQLYRAINNSPPRNFRNQERIFKVVFRGEGATDAGGPYNEAISAICDELMSRFLPLFVPTQNNLHNVGENRDAWIINPSADSPLQLDLLQFLGKLMGVAIRTQNNLNLTLPPLFWKRLMLEEVNLSDLKGVDECCCQMLDILKNLQEHEITPEKFPDTFENICFSTHDSCGRLVELVERGSEVLVSYDRAFEYSCMVETFRLNESEKQYAAIRRGMSTVVPLNLLNLFSWKQVESMVCGAADIDVEVLKGKTEYENVNADAPHIRYFWEILKEITPKDRSQFLRFVWGRSRLPVNREFKKFKITQLNKGGNPDGYMPVAHTCFFQIDLPPYSSKEIMKEKFLYAITHCQAIDLDRIADGGWEED